MAKKKKKEQPEVSPAFVDEKGERATIKARVKVEVVSDEEVKNKKKCETCGGSGLIHQGKVCYVCNGFGKV